jgi:hypothetical protein
MSSTIKLQNGKVVLKNGKPSCECCFTEVGPIITLPCAGVASCVAPIDGAAGRITRATAAAIYAGGTYSMRMQLQAGGSFNGFGGGAGLYEYEISHDKSYNFSGSGCGFGAQFEEQIGTVGTKTTFFTGGVQNLNGVVFGSLSASLKVFDSPQKFCLHVTHSARVRAQLNLSDVVDFEASERRFSGGIPSASSGIAFGVPHFRNIVRVFPTQILPVTEVVESASFTITVSLSSSPP